MKALLMGGQACILYGAAEFSRDIDFAVAADPTDLERLRAALGDLSAETVFFPPLSEDALRRGHACHFRAHAPELHGLRIDVMSVMRGADPFPKLWRRREVIALPGVGKIPVMSLPDLVSIKKTQRDKDWPMVRRLVEADVARSTGRVAPKRAEFWLRECRTPDLLLGLARRFALTARRLAPSRPALVAALDDDERRVARHLRKEEDRERAADRRYWAPLRKELERMREQREKKRR